MPSSNRLHNKIEFIPLAEGEGATVVLTKPDGEVGMQNLTAEEWKKLQRVLAKMKDAGICFD